MLMRKCFALAVGVTFVASGFAAQPNPPPAYSLADLSGTVVDAATGQGLAYAVVQASWVTHPATQKPATTTNGGKRLFSRQVHSKPGGLFAITNGGSFAAPAGWVLVPAQDPVVRVYAEGHRRLVIWNTVAAKKGSPLPADAASASERKWSSQGATFALKPLPGGSSALKQELAIWKQDLEAEIAAQSQQDRAAAIRSQEKLLLLFDKVCRTLPQAARAGLCYEPDSELGRYVTVALAQARKSLVSEDENGEVTRVPVVVSSQPGSAGRAAVPIPADSSVQKLNEAYERELRR
jgi:hypothetical protein